MTILISKQKILFIVFALNALLYSLVYFYPLNDFGEPQIPQFLKLLYDLILVFFIIIIGFKSKLNQIHIFASIFLITILVLGLIHISHTSIADYLHYSVRNIFFYNLFLFLNLTYNVDISKFTDFHERLFKFILYFGLLFFSFQKLGVTNPFGFHEWMWEKNRLIASWLNPNSLGFYLIFYLFYFYFKENKISIFLGLIVASIFLSGSLTAIIGVVFFVGYVSVKFLKSKKLKPSFLLLISVLSPIFIYMIIELGAFDYILFKIDVLFIQKSTVHTSVSTRVQNINDLIEYMSFDNIASILFGDFNSENYRRLDSQYLNIFYNYGLIGLVSYLFFQLAVLHELMKYPSQFSKAFIAFSLWLYLIAFNLTAYLYRPNLVIFYSIMLVFVIHIGKKRLITSSINEHTRYN
ncbi:hypothetical protein BFP77_08680 [Maribacter sp. 4U21]|uniref:O-antigen ligase family protein n=1 Tax=Maribacter sp. 4U21 TaxID=1889779 RepID=UPI000C148DC1|nr:O-antigen ligase family protein [Maribacter sp. 4U21]PIB28701.1 hypothetical protein BFP77_08680 [Maribacter sp. 4U21]